MHHRFVLFIFLYYKNKFLFHSLIFRVAEPIQTSSVRKVAFRIFRYRLLINLNVTVKSGRLDIRSKFFSVRAPAQWNAVLSDIKQLQPAQRFKTAYKQFRENPV